MIDTKHIVNTIVEELDEIRIQADHDYTDYLLVVSEMLKLYDPKEYLDSDTFEQIVINKVKQALSNIAERGSGN